MAENSKIEWCHHTFNPWRGCRALSEACANCYAKVLVEGRLQQDFGIRTRAAESTWKLPLRWDRKAAKEGRRMRVFCASLADVFDAEVPDEWRDELFALIAVTPNLDWLLLTKRPKVARDYADRAHRCGEHWLAAQPGAPAVQWPLPNVWLGTTVENQAMAEARIPHLLATPAAVRFLSMEPLLGPVDLRDWTYPVSTGRNLRNPDPFSIVRSHPVSDTRPGLDWVITGGESGPGARPTHPDWFRSIRDQCAATGVPFLFKQWGEWVPVLYQGSDGKRLLRLSEPESRERIITLDGGAQINLRRLGKKAAGRHLDGVLHDGYPVVG